MNNKLHNENILIVEDKLIKKLSKKIKIDLIFLKIIQNQSIKKIKSSKNLYRIRISKYRVIFEWFNDQIVIKQIKNRDKVYKNIKI